MPSLRTLALALLCSALLPPGASGQAYPDPGAPDRSGAWFELGLGLGSSSVSCQICVQDRRTGTAALLGGGLNLNQSLRLGVEVSGWARFDEVDQIIGSVAPMAFFYPSATRGLFIKAGPSVSFFNARDTEGTEVSSTSFGLVMGGGYEVPLSSGTALTPFLDLVATSFGTLSSDGRPITGRAGVTLIHLGVGLTFH
jgi:hypothetical protein